MVYKNIKLLDLNQDIKLEEVLNTRKQIIKLFKNSPIIYKDKVIGVPENIVFNHWEYSLYGDIWVDDNIINTHKLSLLSVDLISETSINQKMKIDYFFIYVDLKP